MHSEDWLLWQIRESGLRAWRRFASRTETRLRLEHDPVVALERHFAMLVDAVQEDADLRVQDVFENEKQGRNFLSALSYGVYDGHDVEGRLVGMLGIDGDHTMLLNSKNTVKRVAS